MYIEFVWKFKINHKYLIAIYKSHLYPTWKCNEKMAIKKYFTLSKDDKVLRHSLYNAHLWIVSIRNSLGTRPDFIPKNQSSNNMRQALFELEAKKKRFRRKNIHTYKQPYGKKYRFKLRWAHVKRIKECNSHTRLVDKVGIKLAKCSHESYALSMTLNSHPRYIDELCVDRLNDGWDMYV